MRKRIIHWFVLVVIAAVWLFVIVKNIEDRTHLTVGYDFLRDRARISKLYPEDRVSRVYSRTQNSEPETKNNAPPPPSQWLRGGEGGVTNVGGNDDSIFFQEIAASPVYFDIRYWQRFTKATVEIEYDNVAGVEWGMGYKVGPEFQWKIEPVESRKVKVESGEIQKKILEFDLKNEFVERGNKHRWIVSAPDIEETGKGIRMYRLRLIFSK